MLPASRLISEWRYNELDCECWPWWAHTNRGHLVHRHQSACRPLDRLARIVPPDCSRSKCVYLLSNHWEWITAKFAVKTFNAQIQGKALRQPNCRQERARNKSGQALRWSQLQQVKRKFSLKFHCLYYKLYRRTLFLICPDFQFETSMSESLGAIREFATFFGLRFTLKEINLHIPDQEIQKKIFKTDSRKAQKSFGSEERDKKVGSRCLPMSPGCDLSTGDLSPVIRPDWAGTEHPVGRLDPTHAADPKGRNSFKSFKENFLSFLIRYF